MLDDFLKNTRTSFSLGVEDDHKRHYVYHVQRLKSKSFASNLRVLLGLDGRAYQKKFIELRLRNLLESCMTDLTPGTPPSSNDAATQVYPPGRPRPFNEISVLFPLLTLYTTAYLGLMAAEFFLRGAFTVPAGMMPIYIALLGAWR